MSETFEFNSIDVDYIKEKIEKEKEKSQGSKLIWKPPVGNTTIRIFPYKYGKTPFTEAYFHYNVSKNGAVLCSKTNGEECALCSVVNDLYKTGLDEDKVKAYSLKAKLRVFVPIIIRTAIENGQEPKIYFWEMSKTNYTDIIKYVNNEDYGDIADANTGNDLIIEHVESSKENIYGKTTITPRVKKTKVLEDLSLAKKLYDECPEVTVISKLKPLTEAEMLEKLEELKNNNNGDENEEDSTPSTNSEKTDLASKIENLIKS